MIKEEIRIPFNLCDPARIMFFGAYLEIYHNFLENHMEDLGIKWEDWFMNETGAPVRGLNVIYDAPLAFGKKYLAELSIKNLGDSSVTFKFVCGLSGKAHATAEVTHVFVDFKKREKVSIPTHIKQALEAHLLTEVG